MTHSYEFQPLPELLPNYPALYREYLASNQVWNQKSWSMSNEHNASESTMPHIQMESKYLIQPKTSVSVEPLWLSF
ncbi:hypothetical protein CFP56_010492 [Quercus suber]|uniref:Uncharacterized protein n=1 Tax=Quercus suber TaxID=58331 RepID=A0AAW0M5Q1_QUESU